MRNGKRITALALAFLMMFSVAADHMLTVRAEETEGIAGSTEAGQTTVEITDEEGNAIVCTLYSAAKSMTEDEKAAVTDWGIATPEDWLAALEDSNTVTNAFPAKTLHLAADIDMNNQQMKPLAYGGTFAGTLDGHGHVFQNILIEETISGTTPVGLIGAIAATGVVQNLGIESGKVTVTNYTYSSDNQGIGAVAGASNSGSVVIHCWNGADVILEKASKNASISGLVGRCSGTIDGCYNIGNVLNLVNNRAAGLNDWAGTAGYAYNSFHAGTISGNSSGTNSGLYVLRYNTSASIKYANVYGIETTLTNLTKEDTSSYNIFQDAYSSGELAYKLNTGYVEGKGTQTYYTLEYSSEGNKTVFGTYKNQVRKLTLTTRNAAGATESTEDVYVPAGTTYSLPAGSYQVTEGEGNVTIGEDGTFEMPTVDVAITITLSGLSTNLLEAQLARYEGKNTKYFQNSETLTALIEGVKAKLANIGTGNTPVYESQAEIDTDTEALAAVYVYKGYPELPPASERATYSDAPGFLILDQADLEAAGTDASSFAVEQTLYLGADIALTDSTFNGMHGLAASFDGQGHVVSNYVGTSGFFKMYAGTSIKDLTLSNCKITGGYAIAALVEQYTNELMIENVTVKDTTVAKSPVSTQNSNHGIAVLVSRCNNSNLYAVSVRDCIVSDCVLDTTNAGFDSKGDIVKVQNIGMIMAQGNGINSVFDHNLVINSRVHGRDGDWNVGMYLGSCEQNMTITNSTVWGGGLYGADETVTAGFGRNGSLVGAYTNNNLTVSNVLFYDVKNTSDVLRASGAKYGTLTMSNVYYEEDTFKRNDTNCTGTDIYNNVTKISAASVLSAEALYQANRENGDYADWAIGFDTNGDAVICFADEQNLAPVKVTFTALDNSEAEEGFVRIYYTDRNGRMIGKDIAETIAVSESWKSEASSASERPTAETIFVDDTEYTAVLTDVGAEFGYVSLSLEGNIGINYYVSLSEALMESDTAYMQFMVGGDEQKVYVKDVVKANNTMKSAAGKTYYKFTCSVSSVQMTENVKAQMVIDDNTRSRVISYSVLEYARAILGDEKQGQEVKDLVKAMLNYGGYAQQWYAPSDPVFANSILEEQEKVLAEAVLDDTYNSGHSGTVEGITFYGSALVLDSCTAIRHYFTLDEGVDMNDYTYTYKAGADGIQQELVPVKSGGYCYVDIPNIKAHELGTMFDVTVTKKAGLHEAETEDSRIMIHYGAMSYVKNMCGRDTTDIAIKNAVTALYWYGENAAVYYGLQEK